MSVVTVTLRCCTGARHTGQISSLLRHEGHVAQCPHPSLSTQCASIHTTHIFASMSRLNPISSVSILITNLSLAKTSIHDVD